MGFKVCMHGVYMFPSILVKIFKQNHSWQRNRDHLEASAFIGCVYVIDNILMVELIAYVSNLMRSRETCIICVYFVKCFTSFWLLIFNVHYAVYLRKYDVDVSSY
uniref:Uncharacterized protein n=1 Tax=Rhizophora mucronata TaxID=61149 RepID=A0A2P2K871_RHIMU